MFYLNKEKQVNVFQMFYLDIPVSEQFYNISHKHFIREKLKTILHQNIFKSKYIEISSDTIIPLDRVQKKLDMFQFLFHHSIQPQNLIYLLICVFLLNKHPTFSWLYLWDAIIFDSVKCWTGAVPGSCQVVFFTHDRPKFIDRKCTKHSGFGAWQHSGSRICQTLQFTSSYDYNKKVI